MERTLISVNLPNLITIPIMAAGGWLLFFLAAQFWQRYGGGQAPGSFAGG